jgi:hypothetical protein
MVLPFFSSRYAPFFSIEVVYGWRLNPSIPEIWDSFITSFTWEE